MGVFRNRFPFDGLPEPCRTRSCGNALLIQGIQFAVVRVNAHHIPFQFPAGIERQVVIRHVHGIEVCLLDPVRIQEPFGKYISFPSGRRGRDLDRTDPGAICNLFGFGQIRTGLPFLRDRIGKGQSICTLCRYIAIIIVIIDIQHRTAVRFDLGGRRLFLQMVPVITIIRFICIRNGHRFTNPAGMRHTLFVGIFRPGSILLPIENPVLSRRIVRPSGIQRRICAQIESAIGNIDTGIIGAHDQRTIRIGDLTSVVDNAPV